MKIASILHVIGNYRLPFVFRNRLSDECGYAEAEESYSKDTVERDPRIYHSYKPQTWVSLRSKGRCQTALEDVPDRFGCFFGTRFISGVPLSCHLLDGIDVPAVDNHSPASDITPTACV